MLVRAYQGQQLPFFPLPLPLLGFFSDSESQFMAATVFFPKLYLKKLIYKKINFNSILMFI